MTLPHLLARVDELAKIEERAEEYAFNSSAGLVAPEKYYAYLAGAASLSPAIEALREAVTALGKECHCDGKLDYTYSKYTPITCRFCEALRNIERLIEGEKK